MKVHPVFHKAKLALVLTASATIIGFINIKSASTTATIGLSVENQQVRTILGDSVWIYGVAISPDKLASGTEDGKISIWQPRTGDLKIPVAAHNQAVRSVAFSPDGQTLASGSYDRTIKLWNVPTGQLLNTLAGHNNAVWSVAFSPDSQTLASSSYDRTIKLWYVQSGQLLRTLVGHNKTVWSVAFSPDGQTLASGSGDETIKLWSMSAVNKTLPKPKP